MNILVWSSWVAHPVGGQERFALGLALQLHQRGHKVVLVGAYDNAPELRTRIPSEMPYYFFDFHRPKIKPHWATARLLDRAISKHDIHVVSAHGNVFALYAVCCRRNLPLVWTIHGAQPRPGGVVGRLKTMAVAHVMADARTQAVAVSGATAEIMQRQFTCLPATRLHVIHPLHGFYEDALTRLSLPKPGPPWQLGFMGRLAERKRPLDLVEVASLLRNRLEFRLHVFGDGELQHALATAVKRHDLADQFVLHGYWDRGSASMVEQFHILVHPDSVEPFGVALLEAQLGGRPVVAYQVGGNADIVEHGVTGWLVPLGDTAALANGVHTLAGERFSAYADAARQRAMTEFNVSKMTNQYITLFEQACTRN
jgi:glycosyltransferase involved in cell wall biosynthesis